MALIADVLEWDWVRAEAEFERAIELDPSDIWARQTYAFSLASQGRLDEAGAHLRRVREIDPVAVTTSRFDLGLLLVWQGKTDQAVELWQQTLELSPGHLSSLLNLGGHYCRSGRVEEGLSMLGRAREIYPETPSVLAEIGACHAVVGHREDAESVLRELEDWLRREYVDPVNLAVVYLALNDDDDVFAWLERGYELRATLTRQIGSDPRFARLHSDPRFREFIQRIGLREPSPRG